MLSLSGRIRTRNHRPWLYQAKTPLAKKPPTLTGTQAYFIFPLDMCCQRLPVPQVAAQTEIGRPTAKGGLYFGNLAHIQSRRTPRSLPFLQSSQSFPLKAMHPVFHCSGTITKQIPHLATTHSLGNEQHAMQTMVIAGFRASPDLVLQSKNNRRCISNRQRFHEFMIAQFYIIRNYLCPRV